MEHQRTGVLAAQDADDDRIIRNDAGQQHEVLAGMLDGGMHRGIAVVDDADLAVAIGDTEPDAIGSNALHLACRHFEARSLLRGRSGFCHRAKHRPSRLRGLTGLPPLSDGQSLLFPALRLLVVDLRCNRRRLVCEIRREDISRREKPADENDRAGNHGQACLTATVEERREVLKPCPQPGGRTRFGRNNDARQHRFGLLRLFIVDRATLRIRERLICFLDQTKVRRSQLGVADGNVWVVTFGEGDVGRTNDRRVGNSGHTQNQIVVDVDSHLARASVHG